MPLFAVLQVVNRRNPGEADAGAAGLWP